MDDDNYGVDGMDLTSQGAGTYWWALSSYTITYKAGQGINSSNF